MPQGDPSSPLLFLLFINDMLNGMPGINCPSHESEALRTALAGLLYADDTVLLADSDEGMQLILDHLTIWLSTNGLQINASKCNIMRVMQLRAAEDVDAETSAALPVASDLLQHQSPPTASPIASPLLTVPQPI